MTQLCTFTVLCLVEGGQGRASQPINGNIDAELIGAYRVTTQDCLNITEGPLNELHS